MKIHRRLFNGAIMAVFATSITAAWPGWAADYPTKPVKIILPTSAGSGPDVIARIVADRLAKTWQQQVLIINRPGAGGLIGAQAAATVKPDGYTLYMPISSTFVVLPERQPKMPLDLQRDIVPIGLVGEQPMMIAVNSKLGVKTLEELSALAKKHPGQILYGSGPGGLPNLTGELFQKRAAIKLTFVPYANITKAKQDTIGGTLQLVIESESALAGAIRSGLLTPLAVASKARLPNFPDLPTVAEALPGIGTFEARGWFALMARTGTPDTIVRKISEDLRGVLAQAELQQKFAALGTYVRPMSPAELAVFIRGEQALWRPFARQAFKASH